jgi:lysylphosphatidylglycerol synthetase-like protein (DUF2156 family)
LYQPLVAGIAALDIAVIVPWLCGLIVTVLLCVRVVHRLLERQYAVITKIVLGIMTASALMILPTAFTSGYSVIISVLCFGTGYILAAKIDNSASEQKIRIEKTESKNMEDVERAYSIIKECSLDSQHYLSIKEESMFFFGEKAYGMISYIFAGKKAMSIGNPVCKLEDMECLAGEYVNYCEKMGWKPIFNSVSGHMAEILKKQNFSVLKYGEEAILELPGYTLAGGGRAALRRNVSNVEKSGARYGNIIPKMSVMMPWKEKLSICLKNGMPAKNTK